MNRLVVTILGIFGAVGGSALVFIGINKLFDLTEDRYPLFSAIRGGLLSGGLFALLWANRLIESPVIVILIAIVIGTGVGFALGVIDDPTQRLALGVGGGVALGLLVGFSAQESFTPEGGEIVTPGILPSIDPIAVVIGLLIGAGLGFLLWSLGGRQQHNMMSRLLIGTSIGWLFGAWLAADFDGSRVEVLIVAVVLGALVGAVVGGQI